VVVGVDEVGCGAWAGPVTVGAVVMPSDRRVYKLRDSKVLAAGRAGAARRPDPRGRARRGGRPRQQRGDRRGRSERRAPPGGPPGRRRPPDPARRRAARRQLGLPRRLRHGQRAARRRRRPLHLDRGGVDRRQGHPRRAAAQRGRRAPPLRVRVEQGLPVAGAPGGAAPATGRASCTATPGHRSWRCGRVRCSISRGGRAPAASSPRPGPRRARGPDPGAGAGVGGLRHLVVDAGEHPGVREREQDHHRTTDDVVLRTIPRPRRESEEFGRLSPRKNSRPSGTSTGP
jgi:hypothetical protein